MPSTIGVFFTNETTIRSTPPYWCLHWCRWHNISPLIL